MKKLFFVLMTCLFAMSMQAQSLIGTWKTAMIEDGQKMDSCPHSRQKLLIGLSVQADLYDILRQKTAGPAGTEN